MVAKFVHPIHDSVLFKVSIIARHGKFPTIKVIETNSGKEVAVRSLSIDCPHDGLPTLTMTVLNFEVETEIQPSQQIQWDENSGVAVTILPEP